MWINKFTNLPNFITRLNPLIFNIYNKYIYIYIKRLTCTLIIDTKREQKFTREQPKSMIMLKSLFAFSLMSKT